MKLNLVWKEEAIVGSKTRLTRHIIVLPLIGKVFLQNDNGPNWKMGLGDLGTKIQLSEVKLEDAKFEALARIHGLYKDAATALSQAIYGD